MERTTRWVVLALIGGGCLLSASARGAGEEGKPWTLSGTLSALYNDNRDGTQDNKESNLDVKLAPRFDYRYNPEQSLFDFFVAPSIVWHSNPRDASTGAPQHDTEPFISGGLDIVHNFNERAWVKVGDQADYTDDPSIGLGGAAVRTSTDLFSNHAYGDVGGKVLPEMDADLAAKYDIKRYTDQAVANTEDEDVLDTSATARYLMGAGYRVGGQIGYSMFRNASDVRDRGSTIFSAAGVADKTFSPDFKADVLAGYQHASYNDSDNSAENMFHGEAHATFGNAPLRVQFGAMYGVYPPYVQPYSLQKLTSVSAGVEYDVLPSRLTVGLQGQYGHSEYPSEPFPVAAALPGGTENMEQVMLKATYKLNRTFSFEAQYIYENWDSDPVLRESFDENTLYFGVTAQM